MAATETTAPAASSLMHEPTLFDSEDEGGCIILAGLPTPSQNSSYRRDGSSWTARMQLDAAYSPARMVACTEWQILLIRHQGTDSQFDILAGGRNRELRCPGGPGNTAAAAPTAWAATFQCLTKAPTASSTFLQGDVTASSDVPVGLANPHTMCDLNAAIKFLLCRPQSRRQLGAGWYGQWSGHAFDILCDIMDSLLPSNISVASSLPVLAAMEAVAGWSHLGVEADIHHDANQ